jgi:hypothetical protein
MATPLTAELTPGTPCTPEAIKTAYMHLYMTTANAMDAQREASSCRAVLKYSEAVLTTNGAMDAGKNAEQRAAILFTATTNERSELRRAEDALATAEREQALAKLIVSELHDLMRLAEWEQRETDLSLTRVGLRELPALLRLAEAMEDKPDVAHKEDM